MAGVAYYEDDDVVEQYAAYADDGLTDAERDVVDRFFAERRGRVLDVGCGTGRTTGPLADRGFDVVGVDASAPLLDVARDSHPGVPFERGDATDLDFAEESFRCVLFAGLGIDDVRPAARRLRAILEAHRVLEPGGVFAFDANNLANRFLFDPLSPDGWREMARFVARNRRRGTLTSRYASVAFAHGVDVTHAITPCAQQRQLRDAVFDVAAVVKSVADRRPVHLDPRPYYVARKPDVEARP
ncbi:class I SAM-dependent DNA methyltransferase [Halobacterium litoreum]|uniref:Class I SAM-dependent DNA methyltransferase n=1 Tax=Halobacterium litoreum TaxID=2039234 RepID=A0ABD5NID5_9EURY|nr:class I SAM-dependent methyltransferase [Halobacterium litoreum]UHH12163.1 methyltransferase domain-containing protein [Halobacterium litoreum]